MSTRVRAVIVVVVALVLFGAASAYGITSFVQYRARADGPSQVRTTHGASTPGPRIVFRNTAIGAGYGRIATVPVDDPTGRRSVGEVPCDRVYQAGDTMCLRTDRSVLTTFTAYLLGADGATVRSWPLPGIPSRTRMSPDGTLVAFTSFVTGESYGSVAFSTATRIAGVSGADYGNLEDWTLVVDGQRTAAADRNFWGVTFEKDDDGFYATAATAGRTWLVHGRISTRTLTSVRENVECPSLSPDGTRIAYKKRVGTDSTGPVWHIAVLDLASGRETDPPETRSVDDQIEWLDDGTLLYGMPRDDPGDDDVWAIRADGFSPGRVLIPHAWSPSVVRG